MSTKKQSTISHGKLGVSHSKGRSFRIITPLILLLALLILECVLRLAQYGREYDLVLKTSVKGKEYYYINPNVGKRYFDPEHYFLPKIEYGYFEVNKSANTFRVFCLGASTTAGFPYSYNASPSQILKKQLAIAFPEKNIEVINAGLTATNSYTVVDFTRELVRYTPDVLIVYSGQNEFYGALGVGSTLSIGQNHWLIKTYLTLKRLKTFGLFEETVNTLSLMIIGKNVATHSGTLMQQMANDKAISLKSALYQKALDAYRDNIRETVELANENSVPIIISTLVTNQRGLAPFVSLHHENLNEEEKAEFESVMKNGELLQSKSEYGKALSEYQKAVNIDSDYAMAHYRLAQCCDNLGLFDSAAISYRRACDLDGLRFRASSDFNQVLRNQVIDTHCLLADVDSMFRAHSPRGIIGNELLWEHVHPRMNGYILVSRAWYDKLSEVAVFSPSEKEKLRRPVSDSTLFSAIRITQLDETFGALTMQRLLNRWPFKENMRSEDSIPTNDIERVASLFVNGKLRWNEAHYEMGDVYLRKKETELAVKEYEAVNAMYPDDPFPLERMGELYALFNQNEKAEAAFTQSLALSENQITHLKLGVLYLRAKRPDRAVAHLARSLELDPKSSVRFSRSQYEEATFYYALSLFQTGRFDDAKQSLSILMQLNPANEKATHLLRKVQLSKESQVKH